MNHLRIGCAAAALGLLLAAGCGKSGAPSAGRTGRPGGEAGSIYRVADHWADVSKYWQLFGKERQPCEAGWISEVPQLYSNGMPYAKFQTIKDTTIMAVPAYSPDNAVGDTILSMSVSLPNEPSKMTFGAFLLQTTPTPGGSDGVQYQIKIGDKKLFDQLILAYQPQNQEVDLSNYAGQTVTIEMITGPGPAKNASADWAIWVDPKIVAK